MAHKMVLVTLLSEGDGQVSYPNILKNGIYLGEDNA